MFLPPLHNDIRLGRVSARAGGVTGFSFNLSRLGFAKSYFSVSDTAAVSRFRKMLPDPPLPDGRKGGSPSPFSETTFTPDTTGCRGWKKLSVLSNLSINTTHETTL